MSEQYHSVEASDVLESLGSSEQGLTEEEARKRLEELGFNELEKGEGVTALEVFARQFQSFLIALLIFASVLSFLLGETTDAIIISSIVVLNALLALHRSPEPRRHWLH